MANEMFFSPKLPVFEKTRIGTEIFIMSGDKRISVYDDHSRYLGSTARSWRVRVYDRSTGYHHEGVCMHHGLYPTRERALFEVERFRYRADDLIFYVMPVGFEYTRIKLDWDELPEYEETLVPATNEEQIEEACKRLYFMTGQRVAPGTDPLERLCIRYSELILMFFRDEIAQENNLYPFAVANPDTIIYVSGNKAEWGYERSDIGLKSKTYDGIVPAWVYSGRSYNLVSEFGEIGYKRRGYGLIRTA